MEKKQQDKFTYVEFINSEIDRLGWKATDLSKASGVSDSIISRINSGRDMSGVNLFKILQALNLLKDGESREPIQSSGEKQVSSSYPYSLRNKSLHDEVEYILNSGKMSAINSFITGLQGVKMVIMEGSEQVLLQREMVSLLRTISSNQDVLGKKIDVVNESLSLGDAGKMGVTNASLEIKSRKRQ